MKTLFPIYFLTSIFLTGSLSANPYTNLSIKQYEKNNQFDVKADPDNMDYELLNAAVFYETNIQREKHKLKALVYNDLLEESATQHAKDMIRLNFFDHINPKNKKSRTPNDRMKNAGISNPFGAENIADISLMDYPSGNQMQVIDKEKLILRDPKTGKTIEFHTYRSLARQVVDDWMHSPPHRKNLLSKDALELGNGAELYRDKKNLNIPMVRFVQNFQLYEPIKK